MLLFITSCISVKLPEVDYNSEYGENIVINDLRTEEDKNYGKVAGHNVIFKNSQINPDPINYVKYSLSKKIKNHEGKFF